MSESLNEALVESLIKDRRRDRIWRNLRFLVIIVIVLLYAIIITSWGKEDDSSKSYAGKPYVSLIHLDGEIMAGKSFFR